MNAPKAVESEYESVMGNFSIQQAVFSAPDFFAKAVPNKGLDIRGRTSVNLLTDALGSGLGIERYVQHAERTRHVY
ncbi:MAG: hypothetical protein R3B54_13070 [Bdellovibrionota bacterium]